MVLVFGFEHKHFTLQEAFLVLQPISYQYLFADFELLNLSYYNSNCIYCEAVTLPAVCADRHRDYIFLIQGSGCQ